LILLGVTWLFYNFELTTGITKEWVTFRLKPLYNKAHKINWTEIEKAYVRTYSPLKEYGGWKYRLSGNGKAYNVCGNKGFTIRFEKQ
jgi:hypothetical protein